MSKCIDRQNDYIVIEVEVKGGIKNALVCWKNTMEACKEVFRVGFMT